MFLLFIIYTIFILYRTTSYKYYIIKNNFLDNNFIDRIYKTIITERKWIYTTNIGNKKIKHNKNIIIRKKKAINMFNNGLFSYSKYEYDDNTKIVHEVKNYLLRKDVLDMVSNLTG